MRGNQYFWRGRFRSLGRTLCCRPAPAEKCKFCGVAGLSQYDMVDRPRHGFGNWNLDYRTHKFWSSFSSFKT